jgi:hypothetical protein
MFQTGSRGGALQGHSVRHAIRQAASHLSRHQHLDRPKFVCLATGEGAARRKQTRRNAVPTPARRDLSPRQRGRATTAAGGDMAIAPWQIKKCKQKLSMAVRGNQAFWRSSPDMDVGLGDERSKFAPRIHISTAPSRMAGSGMGPWLVSVCVCACRHSPNQTIAEVAIISTCLIRPRFAAASVRLFCPTPAPASAAHLRRDASTLPGRPTTCCWAAEALLQTQWTKE